jgi:shikimate dehydrogenase
MANRIQGTTRLIGLIGTPIKHSLSPHMHNSAFEKTGQDYAYLCLEVGKEGLKQAIDALKLFNAKGSNITFPNKQEVIQYLDEISEDAKIIGSVNTITIDDETKKIKGYNTDGRGFVASIEELKIDYKGKKVVVLGVGGAGRAIAVQLAYDGVGELIIKDIDEALMKEVKETINKGIQNCKVKLISYEEALKEELKDAVLLINATPLGMKGRDNMCAISSAEVLNNTKAFVYDIVYEPRETKLMKYAKEKGLQTINGVNMMLWQGALAYKIWLGEDMPLDYVRGELFEA